jgi:hypothetical protein
MSTFQQIDVIGALEAAGIPYKRSGGSRWVRIKAIWRDSKDADLCVNLDGGGWTDQGGLHEHGAWPALCERLGIRCNLPTRQNWTKEERAEYGRQMAAKRAESDKAEKAAVSENMATAMNHWSRWSTDLISESDARAVALRDFIAYRGLKPETIAQVARAGRSCKAPCLIYGRRDPRTGEITTIHREWDKRTWPKENGTNKRGLGPQFWNDQTSYIEYNRWEGAPVAPGAMAAIAEGQLSGAGGAELYPNSPVLSVFTMGGLERPPVTRIRELVEAGFDILILGDRGGMKAAQECARQILLVCPNARIRIAIPPEGRVEGQKKGEDWLDIRVGYEGVAGLGDDATRALIEQCAQPYTYKAPAPEDGADAKKVAFLPRWERITRTPGQARLTVKAAEVANRRAIREQIFSNLPAILGGDMGLGKTTETAKFGALLWRIKTIPYHLLKRREQRIARWLQNTGRWKKIPPLLFLMPTVELARKLVAQINELAGTTAAVAVFNKGRDEDNCYQYVKVETLMNRGRAPNPQACQTCDHGLPDTKRPEGAKPCDYMVNLRNSVYYPIVVAVHAAGAEDSLLYQHETSIDPTESEMIARKLIVDESPSLFTPGLITDEKGGVRGNITADDLREWRSVGAAALKDLCDKLTKDTDAQVVLALHKKILRVRLAIREALRSEPMRVRDAKLAAHNLAAMRIRVREHLGVNPPSTPLNDQQKEAWAAIRANARPIREQIAGLRREVADLRKQKTQADRSNAGKALKEYRAAISWTKRILVWLQRLDDARHASPVDEVAHTIPNGPWAALSDLCRNVPERARDKDATRLEEVAWSKTGQNHRIPLRGIQPLGEALAAAGGASAFFYKGTIGTLVQTALIRQIVKRGALLMDGTPRLQIIDQVKAAGGRVYSIRAQLPDVAETNLIMGQQRGRAGLSDPKTLASRVEAVQDWRHAGLKAFVHKPIFTDIVESESVGVKSREEKKGLVDMIKRDIRNWGDHTSFNDWRTATHGVMDGIHIPSPLQQKVEYAAYRAAMAQIGIHKEEWDGSQTRGQLVMASGIGIKYTRCNAWLPTVADAREWLHDWVEGIVAQGWARFRHLRPNGRPNIRWDIRTDFPLTGLHGLEITNIRLAEKGRAAQTLRVEMEIARQTQKIEEEKGHASYREIREGVKKSLGITPSMSKLKQVKDAREREALVCECTVGEALGAILHRTKLWLGMDADIQEIARRQAEASPSDTGVTALLAALVEAGKERPRRAQGP